MPRIIRKTADGDIAELPERPAAVRLNAGLSGGSPGTPLLPDHVVEFLNALPMTGNTVDWINGFRDALRKLLGDVDRVAVKINENCYLNDPGRHQPLAVSMLRTGSNKVAETAVMAMAIGGTAPSHAFIEEIRSIGHNLDEYHPPLCYDYHYDGTAYLGSILLFRERVKAPISERSAEAMQALEPFIIFALSDVVTRHHYEKPIDRVFSEILMQVARESNLSTQDIRILTLMLMGLSYKQVADRMELSIDTIRKHTKRIYRKTRTGSLPELFAKYFTPRIGIEGLGEDDGL
ncbi:MAG TPA: LuxR C-terminal-related transcriptional regulator [Candidatus Kapabacteria bacterium]|nr:LuxR C-terminal-related transcriptional regulator [Candidatus Kapabacteria bacterium]